MIERIKRIVSHIIHQYYEKNDIQSIVDYFDEEFSWLGSGEWQFETSKQASIAYFKKFIGVVPRCIISDEEFHVIDAGGGTYICTGRFWVETAPEINSYAKEHQRITAVMKDRGSKITCLHLHVSNPYLAMGEDEVFPDAVSRYSYQYAQEKIKTLEGAMVNRNRQMEVVMKSIQGGLKISNDDENFSYAYVSEEAAALFGYTVEEFLEVTKGSAAGAVYPEDLEMALAKCVEIFATGQSEYAVKYRIQCKDGSLKWILDSGKKTVDEDGICHINSLYLDITASENDAKQILQQKELLDSIYNSVPCGILRYYKNDEKGSVSMNKAVLDILGYQSEADLLAQWKNGIVDHVLEEDKQLIIDGVNSLKAEGDSIVLEYRVLHEDQSIHWVEGISKVIKVSEEGILIQRTMVDITQRIALQQQNISQQQMYRLAMESSNDLMFEYLFKRDLLRVYAPDHSKEEKELKIYEVIDLKEYATDWVHPDDVVKVIKNICKGKCESFDVRLKQSQTDEYIWFKVRGTLISEHDKKERIVGTLRNIQDIKLAMLENDEAVAKNLIAKEALLEAYENIKRANQAKSDFLSRMSHDIRTPMNAIMGMAAIAKKNVDTTEKVEECLHHIEVASQHLLNLLNQVLEMAKIENGSLQLNEKTFSLKEMVRNICDMLQMECAKKQQCLDVKLEVEHDRLKGDEVRLHQIFVNLLSNAIKYTPEKGAIKFYIKEKFLVGEQAACFDFQIQDNGIGMSQAFLKKVFVPFERAEDSRVSKIQGSGLGMAITLNLVQLMDGTIDVFSKVDEGTDIHVMLTLQVDHVDEDVQNGALLEQSFEGLHLLVAEDNLLNQEIVKELLQMKKVKVDCASHGLAALKMFEYSSIREYDGILMDLQMPVMDGFEASQKIRQLPREDAKKVIIVAVTANTFTEDILAAKRAGMDEYLAKPIDILELDLILKKIWENKGK